MLNSRIEPKMHQRRRTGWWLVLLLLVSLGTRGADNVDIEVGGVDTALADNVLAHLRQLSLPNLEEVRRQRGLIIRKARKGMEALGYYESRLQLMVPPPGQSGDVQLQITPGSPVVWRDTAVNMTGPGAQDPVFAKVLEQRQPHSGKVLNQQQYEDLKRQLRLAALSNGYFDATFTRQRLLIDRERHRADVDLEFVTGVRYRFGPVTFSSTRLRKKALQRLVPFKPGDYYRESQITQFNRNLLDTGYFRGVSLHPQHEKNASADSAVVPVSVDLEDNEANRVSVGLGYGTDTGPRIRLNWLKPMVNHYGHSLELSSSLSETRREATGEYKIPAGKPGTDFWSLQTGYLEEQFENNHYRQITYGVSRQQLVWGNWTRTYFTKFKQEYGTIETDVVQTNRPSDAFYITPGISFSQIKSEGGLRPVRGHKLEMDLEFSDPSIGSDTEYVRWSGLAKFLESFTERQQILVRLQLGMLWSRDFSQVPVSARFFAGGDQSIRGYDYNNLAPRDDSGALIGGSRLAIGSVEYLYRFLPNWQAATFIDQGGALDTSNQPVYTGAGVGLRWLSPVGVVSVDIAKALDGNQKFRLHVTMGTVL